MAKSGPLRLEDVKDVYRLIGECRDRGVAPIAWRRHMFEELCRLVDAQVGLGGEVYEFWSDEPKTLGTVDVGWANKGPERKRFYEYMLEGGPAADEFYQRFVRRMEGPLLTLSRPQFIDDREWYSSRHYNDYARSGGIDDRIVSFHALENPAEKDHAESFHGVTLHRAEGKPPFGPRERQLIHWFHQELGPMIGHQLAPATEPPVVTLSPRLRQTLIRLLEGDSEKQIAKTLGISIGTVHKYVSRLYRHFGVQSRGELLAHWAKYDGNPHELLGE